jgi:orotate phosphoribosyltransferase
MSFALKVRWLFDTKALVVSPPNKPFIYTSGLIGPYYVNTHYLCGGEETAADFLSFIDREAETEGFIDAMFARLETIYSNHEIFKLLTDAVTECIKEQFNTSDISHVSGGQRRDWFFAPLAAKQLGIPFLAIYNDKRILDQDGKAVNSLDGARVMNVADLLTVGSSYEKKWIPAVCSRGGTLAYSFNVVDRLQGGSKILENAGVEKTSSLFSIDKAFLAAALEEGCINEQQHKLVSDYLSNPFDSMRAFLQRSPEFMTEVFESGTEKEKSRAKLLLSDNLYNLD